MRFKNKPIKLIDTPGFGDTRGTEFDENHVKSIISTIKEGKSIDMIIIVINGTQARLTNRMN